MQTTLEPKIASRPKTLAEARQRIAELEKRRGIPPASQPPRTLDQARRRLAKPTARHVFVTASDPRNMSVSQLEHAIEAERDSERIGLLFCELNTRRAGQATRAVIERTATMTVSELERTIENGKDAEQRQMLFGVLSRRTRKS